MRFCVLWLLSVFSVLVHANDWELAKEDKQRSIKVFVRAQDSSSYNEFHAQTQVPQPLETVVAVLSDINAWPQWLARLKMVKVLKKQDDQKWLYSVYKLPYPFAEREAVLHTRLSRDAKTHVVTITADAVSNYPVPFVPEAKRVRLTNLHSVWRLTPVASGGTLIELSGRGEPEGLMPALIFNYNLPDEPQQTLRLLRQMLLRPQYAAKAEKTDNKQGL